jgi:hypothetical protein
MNRRAGARVGVLLACALWAGVGAAMDDPTRPPTGFYSSGATASASGDEGPVLQSVLISESERLAIISGQLVAIGSKVAGGRLVKVSETEVVLQQGAARRTLKLYPGVDKREPGTQSAHGGGRR